MALFEKHFHFHFPNDNCKLDSIIEKLNQLIMTNAELKELLTAANTKVDKIKTEIQALKDLVANSANVPQQVVDAVNALGANLQSADDMNEDPPTP